MDKPTGMTYDINDYVETTYGPAGFVVGFLDQPSYILEARDGTRTTVAKSTIKSVRRPQPLPTIPGYYVGDYAQSPSGRIIIELLNSPEGQWVDNTDSRYLEFFWVQRLGNLTRLVEVRDEPATDDSLT